MKLLFAASECVPFIKTGGLADVVGSLPVQLAEMGEDARVILPKYRLIADEWKQRMRHICSFSVLFGQEQKFCGVETLVDRGVTYYFVDNEEFFYTDAIYGDGPAEGLRFAFFCRAVLEAMPRIDFMPDVLHLNDWQTGLIAALLRTQYQWDERMRDIRTVFSIHNLRYQGIFNWADMNARLGLPEGLFTPDYLEFYGCLSCMKAGIVFADHVATVSPSYAEEIKTDYYGERLDGLLRMRGNTVSGILNGIDTKAYDPAADPYLAAPFDAAKPEGKTICKSALQREFGLAERPDTPVVGMISRLTPQKGFDLVERVLSDIMRMDIQIVFLGSGDKRYVDLINWAAWRYEGQIGAYIGLDEGLAHRIYAGSDLFLMPSQFEPCGLSQMIALRYGSVPIVRETGGLRDSIRPYNKYTDEGNGFSFANYNAHEMLFTLERAVGYYSTDKAMWRRLMLRGMRENFGWSVSAEKYLALYRSLCGLPHATVETPVPPERQGMQMRGFSSETASPAAAAAGAAVTAGVDDCSELADAAAPAEGAANAAPAAGAGTAKKGAGRKRSAR